MWIQRLPTDAGFKCVACSPDCKSVAAGLRVDRSPFLLNVPHKLRNHSSENCYLDDMKLISYTSMETFSTF